MKAFISHSFQDKEKWEDVSHALSQKDVDYFDPTSLKSGLSLSEQLRRAILDSDFCIFVATHNSIKSAWCMAELGAFWGAGKSVIIYLADTSLDEDHLPKQFNGHLFERSLFRVADRAKELTKELQANKTESSERLITDLTTTELKGIVISAVSQIQAPIRATRIMSNIVDQLSLDISKSTDIKGIVSLQQQVSDLLNFRLSELPAAEDAGWRYAFIAPTSTGTWKGYGLQMSEHAHGDVEAYSRCLLLRIDNESRIVTGAALSKTVVLTYGGVATTDWSSNVLFVVGKHEIGKPLHMERR